MSYRQALALGWGVAWRAFWWSLVITSPLLVTRFVVARLAPIGSARVPSLDVILIPLVIVLEVFIALPLSIREAVVDTYSDFRLSLRGPAHRGEGLTYFESLQVSLLAFAVHGGLIWLCYGLHLPDRLGPAGFVLIQLPFLWLVVYPAIAAIIVRVPFLGFRIFMVHNAPPAERGPAVST